MHESAGTLLRPISEREAGAFRYDLLHILNKSTDPFAVVRYRVRLDRIQELMAKRARSGSPKGNLTHALNKFLAAAIAANPEFNQIVCGSRLYQVAGIHIANVVLVPGSEQALSNIIISNAHQKSLSHIAADFDRLKTERRRQAAAGTLTGSPWIRLYFRLRLYRLLSEKMLFHMGMRSGLASNIILSNHFYGEHSTFEVVKPVHTPTKVALRIHTHTGPLPASDRGAVVDRDMLRLTVIIDHRIIHGIHAHRFGKTMEAIAERPEAYLL